MNRPSRFGALKQLRTPEPDASPDAPTAPQEPEQGRAAPPTPPQAAAPVQAPPASQPPRIGRPPGKRSDTAFRQVSALVRRDTYRATQRRLLDEERDFSELVESLLAAWLAGEVRV